jgi:hypothetical protein
MDPGWVKTRMGGDGAILEPHESISGMLDTIHKAQKNGETAKYYTVSASSSVPTYSGTNTTSAQRQRDPVVSVAWQVASYFLHFRSRKRSAGLGVVCHGTKQIRACNVLFQITERRTHELNVESTCIHAFFSPEHHTGPCFTQIFLRVTSHRRSL